MTLHETPELLRAAILSTAAHKGLRPLYIEKDYWVTYLLHVIFHSEHAEYCVFKGGTSLSKAYKLIDRFSEDVDLVVTRQPHHTDYFLKRRLRSISNQVNSYLPEIQIDGVTRKVGQLRKTAHHYERKESGTWGQVRDFIVLEVSTLGNSSPHEYRMIQSMIAEFLVDSARPDEITKYGLESFSVPVLTPFRTFCEKIMSLVRFSCSENPIIDLRNKIRHIYDVHLLLQDRRIQEEMKSPGFDELLVQVAQDDFNAYKNNRAFLYQHPKDSLLFREPDATWTQLKSTYVGTFSDLVTRELPPADAVLKTLFIIQARLNSLSWPFAKPV